MPEIYKLAATGNYPFGNSVPDNNEVGIISFQVEGSTSPAWSGSAVVEARQFAGGLGWEEVPYYNVLTKSTVAAGTAITGDGLFEVDANGREVRLAYTHTAGSAVVVLTPMRGIGASLAAASGGGGGGDVNLTEVGGAAIALGQAAMAASLPVVIASNQSSVPVTVSAALPAGTNNIGDVDVLSLPALPAGNNNIGDVDVASLPAIPTGSNTIGAVNLAQYTPATGRLPVDGSGVTQPVSGNLGGFTAVLKPTVTVSTSPAYQAGDDVGGKITIANAVRTSGGTAYLQSVTLLDAANQKAAMTLYLFDADPSAATITDNSPFAFSTDFTKCIGQVTIAAADYITTDSKAIAVPQFGAIPVKAASGTSLYAALVTTGTPTYAATTNISLALGFVQD